MVTRLEADEAAALRRAAALREAERRRAEAAAAAAAAAAAKRRVAKLRNDEFSTGQTKSLRVRELQGNSTPMAVTPATAPTAPAGSTAELKQKLADAEASLRVPGMPSYAQQSIAQQVETLKDQYVAALEADITKLEQQRSQAPGGLRHELDELIRYDRSEISRVRPEPPEAKAQRVAEAYTRGGALEASEQLRTEVAALGDDTARIDALLAAAKPTLDRISADLGTRIRENQDDSDESPVTRDVLGNLAAITDAAGTTGTDLIAESLAAAVSANAKVQPIGRGAAVTELNQLDDRLNDLLDSGHAGKLADALGEALQTSDKPTLRSWGTQLQDKAIDAVDKSRENAQAANGTLQEHEARLAEDLQMFGPAMTPEQRQDYAEAFWALPEHAKAKSDATAAQADFSRQLEAMTPVLVAKARAGDDDAAKALLEGAETLALSDGHAAQAVDLVELIGNDEELFRQIDDATSDSLETRLADNVLAQALPRMQADALATHDEAAFDEKIKALTRLKAAPKLATEIKKLADTLARLRAEPNLFRMDQLLESKGKLGVAMKSIAVAAAVVTLADGDATKLQQLQATLSTVRAGYELGSSVLSTFAKTAELTGDVAKFGAKFLPYVGLAIDSAQFAADIKKLIDGGNVGDGIFTLGTGIALLGDLAGCIPVLGTLPDAALGALGAIVQGIGGLISNLIDGNEEAEKLEAERNQLLDASGISADVKELLTTFDESTLKRMGMLGLDRSQVIGLLQEEVAVFETGKAEAVQAFMTAMDVGAGFGLEGDDLLDFMKDFTQAAAEDPSGMYEVQNVVGWLDFHSDGLSHDAGGNVTDELKTALQSDQDTVRIVLQRLLPPDVISRYGIDTATTADINVGYYAAA